MKLIVGLGNPGNEYANTRHNAGFMCVDNYVGNIEWKEKFNALYTQISVEEEKVLFIKPLTYMNLSGNAVRKFVDYYKIDVNDILVIQDDMDLALGKHKIKVDSSSGGHNGIKSIIESLGTKEFARLKIGIAHSKNEDTKDYVLGKFSNEDLRIMNESINISKNIIDSYIHNGIERTMNTYNTK